MMRHKIKSLATYDCKKKSREVFYKCGRMSPGVQIKRVKSHSPGEMRTCISIVTHIKGSLGEPADGHTASVATPALPWAHLGLPHRLSSFLWGDKPTPKEEINGY